MPARLLATRRAALAGAGALVWLGTGCDADVLDPRPAPSGPSVPDEDADDALVEQVRADLARAAGLVAAARATPALRAPLGGLAALHAAHLAELGGSESASPAPPSGPAGDPAPGRRDVVREEQALQQRLAQASVSAGSAELARVLGSMSAAVAQQVAALGSGS